MAFLWLVSSYYNSQVCLVFVSVCLQGFDNIPSVKISCLGFISGPSKGKSDPLTGPVVCQNVGRGVALLFHDRGTRRGWVVSSMSRPHFTPGKDLLPVVQEAGWASGPVWTSGKSRPTGIRSPDHPAHSRYTDWATRPTSGPNTEFVTKVMPPILCL